MVLPHLDTIRLSLIVEINRPLHLAELHAGDVKGSETGLESLRYHLIVALMSCLWETRQKKNRGRV